MFEFLTWLEDSALGHAMRGLGVWSYGLFNLAHILGVAVLFGSVLVLDLRLLGFWRRIGIGAIATPTVPLAAGGFTLAAASGICMIATNATEYFGNPFLYIKMPAIALGLMNVITVGFLPGWRARALREPSERESRQLALAGAFSLLSWLTVVGAGRMIGYW